ncbi:MAG: hypothetical protein IJ416_10815 [Ruminiclostridium sp.]|nr:hypothetical protein [Ruminiclostridium sp.]
MNISSSIDFFIICLLAVPAIIVIILIALIIYGIVKKKRRIAVISSLILVIPAVLIVGYSLVFPTIFPYVDSLIYGKTKAEVIEIYGEPELNGERRIGYYIGVDNRGIDPSYLDLYYYVYFDENGLVDEIYSGVQPGG